MYEETLKCPGDGSSAFVTEDAAAKFLAGVSDDTLDAILEHYPWVRKFKPGRVVHYLAIDIGIVLLLATRNGFPGKKS